MKVRSFGIAEGACCTPISALIGKMKIHCRLADFMPVKMAAQPRELENLKAAMEDLKQRCDVAESRGERLTSEALGWLAHAEDVVHDIDGLAAVLDYASRYNLYQNYRLRRRAKDLNLRVSEGIAFIAKMDSVSVPWSAMIPQSMPSIDIAAVGMEGSVKELVHYLKEEEVVIIGINGMWGSGKTTLMQSVFNLNLCREKFDAVVWIYVGTVLDVRRMQREMMRGLGFAGQLNENQDIQAARIYKMLVGKRFLLVLDDVWELLDLEALGVPPMDSLEKVGCKVMFSTRSRTVCDMMGAQRIVETGRLSKDHAWDLFCSQVDTTVMLQPEIRVIAEQIVEICGGLPVELIVVGRALALARTEAEWKATLNMVHAPLESDDDGDGQICSAHEISYENLGTKLLKDCFLYCSLFPEDSITKLKLIGYWMGEGFFNDLGEYGSLYKAQGLGLDILQQLEQRSMVKKGNDPESNVNLNDDLREFVLHKRKNKFLVRTGRELVISQSPQEIRWEKIERMSLTHSNIRSLDVVPNCPRMLTLILRCNPYLQNIPENIFQSRALRVLDLSNTGIREIPSSIGSLLELRYLDLSFTKITYLPEELKQLAKLMHFGLEGTSLLTEVPVHIISKLSNVMVLNMYGSYGDWQVKECQDVESRASLEELDCLKRLDDLGITICSVPAFRRFLSSLTLRRSTRKLMLMNCQDLSTFHLSSFFKHVKELTVSDCFILKEFIIDGYTEEEGETPSLSLEVLQLLGLYEAQILVGPKVTPGDCLWMLRELTISFCHMLTDITWVSHLKRLERLNLNCCKEIEFLIDVDSNAPFHKLKAMTLCNLPNLESICARTLEFPCLELLKVSECPQLTKIPLGTQSAANSIRLISGEKAWWEDLEWEDQQAMFVFHKYFQAD